jgi:hypothetical protein
LEEATVLKKILSILTLASIVTGAALWSGVSKVLANDEFLQARPAATAEVQQGSSQHRSDFQGGGDYANGYRYGYRLGFQDGYHDGLSGNHIIRERNYGQSAYELGFSRGYRQGYQDGFHRGTAEARPGNRW